VKTAWFYCKRFRNDGALNFVQFVFTRPSLNFTEDKRCKTWPRFSTSDTWRTLVSKWTNISEIKHAPTAPMIGLYKNHTFRPSLLQFLQGSQKCEIWPHFSRFSFETERRQHNWAVRAWVILMISQICPFSRSQILNHTNSEGREKTTLNLGTT